MDLAEPEGNMRDEDIMLTVAAWDGGHVLSLPLAEQVLGVR